MDAEKKINVSMLQSEIHNLNCIMTNSIRRLSGGVPNLQSNTAISEEEKNQIITSITKTFKGIVDLVNDLPEANRTEQDQLQEIKSLSDKNEQIGNQLVAKIDYLKDMQAKVSELSREVISKSQQ